MVFSAKVNCSSIRNCGTKKIGIYHALRHSDIWPHHGSSDSWKGKKNRRIFFRCTEFGFLEILNNIWCKRNGKGSSPHFSSFSAAKFGGGASVLVYRVEKVEKGTGEHKHKVHKEHKVSTSMTTIFLLRDTPRI